MKILIIGCGSIGKRHISNLIRLKQKNLLAFDINLQMLKDAQKISSSIACSDNLERLLRQRPEAAFITVPTALHTHYAIKAAKAGCHLFIEKPLAHTTDGLEKLIRIVKAKRLVTFIGYNFRFNSCLCKIKKLIEDRAIGKIVAGRTHFGSYLPERHPGEDYRLCYGACKSKGGGVILDTISHHVDYLSFLFGKPKETLCYAQKGSSLDIDVEDTVELLITFPHGSIISLHGDSIQRPYKHTLEFIGDKGTIICDFFKAHLQYYTIPQRRWQSYHGDKDLNTMYLKESKHFLRCVRRDAHAPVDIIKAKEELLTIFKIKRSAAIRKWIKL